MFTGFVNLKEQLDNLSKNIYMMTDVLQKDKSTISRILF